MTGGDPGELPPSAEVLAAAGAAKRRFEADVPGATERNLDAGLLVVCLPLNGDLPACDPAPSAREDVGPCFVPSRKYRATAGEDSLRNDLFWKFPEARVVAGPAVGSRPGGFGAVAG